MKTIKQRGNKDCAVACLAMFLGVKYEESLSKLNVHAKPHYHPNDFLKCGLTFDDIASCFQDKKNVMKVQILPATVKAIICVPSICTEMAFHYIYWDGYKCHDPANHKCYTTEDILENNPIIEALIFSKDLYIMEKEIGIGPLPQHLKNDWDWEYLERIYGR